MGKARRRPKSQLTPATPKELEAFKQEHGLDSLDKDPPGTKSMSLGEFFDRALGTRRRRAAAKR